MHLPLAPRQLFATASLGPLAAQALNSVDAAVSIVDILAPGSPLVFVNDAFCRLTGYAPSEVLGRNCKLLQHPDAELATIDAIRLGIQARLPLSVVLRNLRRDGSAFWNALQLMPLKQPDGPVTHYIGFQHDVSEWGAGALTLLSMDARGQAQARQRFDTALADTFLEHAAGPLRHMVVVLCGGGEHAASGVALPLPQRVSVTARLREFMAPSAALCFLEDAALALLLPVPDDETPGSVAEKVLQSLRPVWACFAGLAEPRLDGADATGLLDLAHGASRRAAASGAEGPHYADPARAARDQRSRHLMRDIALALPAGQLRLVYQPIVNLASGQVTGLEALLRWRHPTLGEVSPGEFIAQLERMPEIQAVTHWVIDTALAQLAHWGRELGRPLRVAVNVPAEALVDGSLVSFVRSALERHQLCPLQLEVELTERSLARADGPAVERLRELRRHGVRVAIDDFGTGWSSLAYLARLPLDTLKVDMQFTRGVTERQADAAISRMTVELARGLGLHCVAEGIERPGQLRFFADLHCHEGQGYLFSRPLEADAVHRLLTASTPFSAFDPIQAFITTVQRHLLLVSDDPSLQQALEGVLCQAGYQIHLAATSEAAFDMLALYPVGVVLADWQLPGMRGSEFLRQVNERHAATHRILLAGQAEVQALTDTRNPSAAYKLLARPWTDADVRSVLEAAFDEFELSAENQRLHSELQRANQQLAQALEAQAQRLRHGETALDVMHAALGSVAVPVLGLDADGALVVINDAAERLFGLGVAVLGEPIAHLLGLDTRAELGAKPQRVRLGGVDHDLHCTPMTDGCRTLGLMVTLLESPA